jgi:hypothetical protein
MQGDLLTTADGGSLTAINGWRYGLRWFGGP